MTRDDELQLHKHVTNWFKENIHMFNMDSMYGLDLYCEVYRLVKECIDIEEAKQRKP